MNIFNIKQLHNILNTNIMQLLLIFVKTILKHKMNNYLNKDLHNYIFNSSNDEKLIKDLSNILIFDNKDIKILENSINEYISNKKINITQKLSLQLNPNELTILIQNHLINTPYWKLIKQELRKIQNKTIPSTLKEIYDLNLQIGQTVPISNDIITKELHSMYVTPIIYINGNIIKGQENATFNASAGRRQYHSQIITQYLHNMSLHNNDIEKKTKEE